MASRRRRRAALDLTALVRRLQLKCNLEPAAASIIGLTPNQVASLRRERKARLDHHRRPRRQLFESRGQLLRFYLLQGAGGFIAAGVLDSRRKNVAEFFQAQRFLRRKQNRFQNGFQIHA